MIGISLSSHRAGECEAESGLTSYPQYNSAQGRAIHSRAGDLVGYWFDCISDPIESEHCDQDFLDQYLIILQRIRSSWLAMRSSSGSGFQPQSVSSGSWILLNVSSSLLLQERFQNVLIATGRLADENGSRLCLALSTKDLSFVSDLRLLRRVTYVLSDHNIGFSLRDPFLGQEPATGLSMIERASQFVSVTPEWLGIGSDSKQFNHSLFIERVTRMSNAIHQLGKMVIYEQVENDWHESFITSLPISYFSRIRSSSDIYI